MAAFSWRIIRNVGFDWTKFAEVLRIGNQYTEELAFTVTRLKYNIILGLPWLENQNKEVDWCARTLTFAHREQRIVLRAFRGTLQQNRQVFGFVWLEQPTSKDAYNNTSPCLRWS
jgi:hypothetical protein